MPLSSPAMIAGLGPFGSAELIVIAVLLGIVLGPVAVAMVIIWVVRKNSRQQGTHVPPPLPSGPASPGANSGNS